MPSAVFLEWKVLRRRKSGFNRYQREGKSFEFRRSIGRVVRQSSRDRRVWYRFLSEGLSRDRYRNRGGDFVRSLNREVRAAENRTMKAVVDVGASSGAGSNLSGVQNGRVNRKKDVENEEIQMYLSKLKDLVPFMPKNKKLSKLEVIQYVIDYICDLQYALETHPSVNNFNAVELTARLQGENGTPVTTVPPTAPNGAHRQPLGVLAPSPNTIISTVSSNALAAVPMEHASLQSMSPVHLEKIQETDSRPISC